MKQLLVVPIDPTSRVVVPPLREGLERSWNIPVAVADGPVPDSSSAYDPSRNQYYSTALLASLIHHHSAGETKLLGLTSFDLYVPVLTFVFGEAQLNGVAAIVSTHRLDESFYGLPSDTALFHERLVKEAVHELGHTFGLIHCRDLPCVMHASTSVEEIDLKTPFFCPSCRGLL